MQIKIGIPCQDMMHSRFVESLTSMRLVGNAHIDWQIGTMIYVGRENIVLNCIKDESDYVLFIDSDMVFDASALERLLETAEKSGAGIVTGLCVMRRPPYEPVIWQKLRVGLTPEAKVAEIYHDYPKNDVFEVDACGMAFTLIKREVIKDVMDRYNTCFSPLPGYGEDISFCIRAKQCGHKIECNSAVKIGHIGQTLCTEDTYIGWREKAANLQE